MSLLAYKFRVYPSRKQKIRLFSSFITCKQIYNEILSLNKDAYKFGNVTLNKFDFNKYLAGKFEQVHSQTKQNVSDRVHKAFANFFRRVKDKSCKEKGFPRYKSRVNSITYPQSGFKFISSKHIKISKIGNLPIILHRVPKGKIKTLTIKRTPTGKWFAVFSCELPDTNIIHANHNSKVGIDVGLENFATLSNGTSIPNPRYLVRSEQRLKFLQRKKDMRRIGSAKRNKMRLKVARLHERVANQRTDFHHKISRFIVNNFGYIAVEDLNIKGMVQNHRLAKHISDAGWGGFISKLCYKAESAGCRIDKVSPAYTSQRCVCGSIVRKTLSDRIHFCTCGYVVHRDILASNNILFGSSTLGMRGSNASGVVPIGTAVNEEAYSKTNVLV